RGFEKARQPDQLPALDTGKLRAEIAGRLDPATTVAARTRSLVEVGTWNGAGDDLEPVMAAPRFPQPMWEALRELSQRYILPGVERPRHARPARPRRPAAPLPEPSDLRGARRVDGRRRHARAGARQ